MTQALAIQWIDGREENVDRKMSELRQKLSPRGDIVSTAGRRRTIEIFGKPLTPQQIVEMICRDIDKHGLSALLDYNKRIDRAEITPEMLRVSEAEIVAAHQQADPAFLQTLCNIRENIWTFQSAILHKDVRIECRGGYIAERYRPMRRVGICVPGGMAAYPSTVLMTAVPAQVAGVKELAVIAPPTKFGSNNPDLLATCWELGIKEIYRMGGAQGVAALAYGITINKGEPNEQTLIPKVDKIVGPGNLFVALAKKFVFGEVDIDSIAGPSEVVIIVDSTTEPEYTAFDMLAQAEHAPGASILIGWDKKSLEKTVGAIEKQLAHVERGELARQSLEDFGAVIVVRDAEEACVVTDAIAPEHLHIATQNAEELADRISCAGAMFLGNYTPVAVGDYAAGPSHVLPTSGTARFASGLTCNDFLRANSLLHFERSGLAVMADDIQRLATKEGLTAHRASVEVRLKEKT
ncbi:MAG: histidinol dehydrogenase [Planctomycetaceae bacterium]|jgi:histidinol dehydrogenase|nr:histidinol dehydrogenase [Planctomycetaceae bacterium]